MARELKLKEIADKEKSLAEQFRLTAEEWVDAESAAHLLEELKGPTLEQKKADVINKHMGQMAENKAERIVKSSKDWEDYIKGMCTRRTEAIRLKMKLEYIRMRHSEWMARDATQRAEMKLTRSGY